MESLLEEGRPLPQSFQNESGKTEGEMGNRLHGHPNWQVLVSKVMTRINLKQ